MRKPNKTDREIHAAVVDRNERISDVARRYAMSPSSVRRALDRVTKEKTESRGTI